MEITGDRSERHRGLLRAMTMGGYQEVPGPSGTIDWLAQVQSKYIRDKAELRAEMAACAENSDACKPAVKSYTQMIEQARKLPDKMTQLQTVNAWVNQSVPYKFQADWFGGHTTNGMVDTLSGIGTPGCDDIARLKLSALEDLNFNASDVQQVFVNCYVDGKLDQPGHTFVEARVNGKNWILDDNNSPHNKESGKWTHAPARQRMAFSSKMEPDNVKLNATGNSFAWDKNLQFVPYGEFNAYQRAVYQGTSITQPVVGPVAAEAMTATAQTTSLAYTLDKKNPTAAQVERILNPAFGVSDQSARTSHAATPKVTSSGPTAPKNPFGFLFQ